MQVAQGLIATHQMEWGSDEIRDGLWQRVFQDTDQCLREFLDSTGVHARLLHLLRRVVIGLHAHGGELHLLSQVDIRMLHLDAIVEDAWSPEHQVFRAYLVCLFGILASIEPYQVHDACAIREMGHHAFLARSHLKGLETEDASYDLHERHVASEFVNGIDLRAVHIFIWIILEQVAIGLDAQLLAEHLLAVGTYPRQIHDILIEYIHL